MKPELTLATAARALGDEAFAWELMEAFRWPNGPVCPHCGSTKAYYLAPKDGARTRTRILADGTTKTATSHRRVWKCGDCRKQYTVLVGSVFEDSRIPVGKWLYAVHALATAKNGVAANELRRDLGIDMKSAWFMLHRIRYAMARPPLVHQLNGVVEADETYMGGKAKNMHKADRERKITGTGGVDKVPVLTLVNRETGEARSQVMRTVTSKNVGKVLHEHISPAASLMTDQSNLYPEAGKAFKSHERVDHGKGEYVRGEAHSNTVEGFFSQLKRSIDGTHHHVSEKHLHRYLAEFDWRYSSRGISDAQRAELTIRKAGGKRLTYKQPIRTSVQD
jgi:transposase-like protein